MARKIRTIPWGNSMPQCDFCVIGGHRPIKDGVYDGPTVGGPWANMCHTHMLQHTPRDSTMITKRTMSR